MSKTNINVNRIANAGLRDHGEKIEITLASANKTEVTATFKISHLADLIGQLIKIHTAAQTVAATSKPSDPAPKSLQPIPPQIYVDDISLVAHESGATSLRITDINGEEVIIHLREGHLQFLLDSIQKSGRFGQDPGIH